jgi:hypothetical protein
MKNTAGSFFTRMRQKLFKWRINLEIHDRLFPHQLGEKDYGYPFSTSTEMNAQTEKLDVQPLLDTIEGYIRNMPDAYGESFRYIMHRDLHNRFAIQVDRTIERVALEATIADRMIRRLERERKAAVKGQEAAIARCKADLATCDKQIDLLLDMRLNEQINEPEYVSKKHVLVNRKAELEGKLEAFERNRHNWFEPAIQFVLQAKNATILLTEGNREKNRDFLKKIGSNFHVAEKSLTVEFKNPWNLLAEFNSARTTNLAACGAKSEISHWRKGGDSNNQSLIRNPPFYKALR